jgi:hypothetical protein
MKLLLLDSLVDYKTYISSRKEHVEYIVFDNTEETYSSLLVKIKGVAGSEQITDIALVQHAGKNVQPLRKEAAWDLDSRDLDYNSISGFKTFIEELRALVGLQRFDMLACALYNNDGVRRAISWLEAETGVDLRASVNFTGNMGNMGAAGTQADWIMESDSIDIREVYFTDAIKDLKELLILVEVGSGNLTLNDQISGESPFFRYYEGAKQQYIYTATEISGLIFNRQLTSVAFNVDTVGVGPDEIGKGPTLENFTIYIGNTTQKELYGQFIDISGKQQLVRSPSNYLPVLGINTFDFSATPFIWDGFSNIVVTTLYCMDNNQSPNNYWSLGATSVVYSTITPVVSAQYYFANDASYNTILNFTDARIRTNRPNIVLNGEPITGITINAKSRSLLGQIALTIYSSADYSIYKGGVKLVDLSASTSSYNDDVSLNQTVNYSARFNLAGVDYSGNTSIKIEVPSINSISNYAAGVIRLFITLNEGSTYIPQRSIDNSSFTDLCANYVTGEIYDDTTIGSDRIYYYRLKSKRIDGVEVFSQSISIALSSQIYAFDNYTSGAIRVILSLNPGESYILQRTGPDNSNNYSNLFADYKTDTSYNDTTLLSNGIYYYRLNIKPISGNDVLSTPTKFELAPRIYYLSNYTSGKVKINVLLNENLLYKIQRSGPDISNVFTDLCSNFITDPDYEDTTISSNGMYYYRIYGKRTNGDIIITSAPSYLLTPYIIQIINQSLGSMTIKSIINGESYRIQRSGPDTRDNFADICSNYITDDIYIDNTLPSNGAYYYKLIVKSSDGSEYVPRIEYQITYVTITFGLSNYETGAVSITPNLNGGTSYKIQRSLTDISSDFIDLSMNYITDTSYNDTTIPANGKYYYRVKGRTDASGVFISNIQSVTTTQAPFITLNNYATGAVRITPNLNGAISYKVQRSTNDISYTDLSNSYTTDTSYNDTTIPANGRYYYRIIGLSSSGGEFTSPSLSILLLPSILELSNYAVGAVRITPNLNGAISYKVQRSLTDISSDFIDLSMNYITDASYNDTTIPENGTYYYRIIGLSSSGVEFTSPSGFLTTTRVPFLFSFNNYETGAVRIIPLLNGATSYKVQRSLTDISSDFIDLSMNYITDTSYNDTTIPANGTYYYRVKGRTDASGVFISNIISVTTTQAPFIALNNYATGAVRITPNLNGAISYKVQRSTNDISYTDLSNSYTTDASYDDTTIPANGTYYYRIVALTDAGGVFISNIQSVTTTQAPFISSLNNYATGAVRITPNLNGAISYKVQRSTNDISYTDLSNSYTTDTSYNDTTLPSNGTYYYKIVALNDAGGEFTSPSQYVIASLIPSFTSNHYAVGAVRITPKLNGAVSYKVQRSLTDISSDFVDVCSNYITDTSYNDTTLPSNGKYYYRAIAKSLGGFDFITNVTFIVTTFVPTIAIPNHYAVGAVRITPTLNGAVSYKVQRSLTDISSDFVDVCSNYITDTSYNDTTLLSNGVYYYRVVAKSLGGIDFITNITPIFITLSPTIETPINYAVGAVRITPTLNGAVSYKVQRSLTNTSSDFVDVCSNYITDTSYNDTTLSSNRLYYYRAIAKSLGGFDFITNVRSIITTLGPTIAAPNNYAVGAVRITPTLNGAVSYKVQRSLTNASSDFVDVCSNYITDTSYNDTTLPSNRIYYYRAVTKLLDGIDFITNVTSIITTLGPTIATPINYAVGAVRITPTLNGAVSYKVQRSLTDISSDFVDVCSNYITDTSYNDISVPSNNVYYYYRAIAKSLGGFDFTTNELFILSALVPTIAAPNNYAVGAVRITPTLNGAVSYKVQRSLTDVSSDFVDVCSNYITDSSYNDITLPSNALYYYRAIAKSLGGIDFPSTIRSITPTRLPLVSLVKYEPTVVTLTSTLNGATSYIIQVSDNNVQYNNIIESYITDISYIHTSASLTPQIYRIVGKSLGGYDFPSAEQISYGAFIHVNIKNNTGVLQITSYAPPYNIGYNIYNNESLIFSDPSGLINVHTFNTTEPFNNIRMESRLNDGTTFNGTTFGSPINFNCNIELGNINYSPEVINFNATENKNTYIGSQNIYTIGNYTNSDLSNIHPVLTQQTNNLAGYLIKFDMSYNVLNAVKLANISTLFLLNQLYVVESGEYSGIYIVGFYNSGVGVPYLSLSSTRSSSFILLKFNLDLQFEWSRRIDDTILTLSDYGSCISINNNGIFVGGAVTISTPSQTIGVFNNTTQIASISGDIFYTTGNTTANVNHSIILQFNSSGTYISSIPIPGNDRNVIIKDINASDAIYITGYTRNNVALNISNSPTLVAFVTKYDYDNKLQWTQSLDTSGSEFDVGNDFGMVLQVTDDAIYTGGVYDSKLRYPLDISDILIYIPDMEKYYASYIIKYNKEGVIQWAKSFYSLNPANTVSSSTTISSFSVYNNNLYVLLTSGYYNNEIIERYKENGIIKTRILSNGVGKLGVYYVKYDVFGNYINSSILYDSIEKDVATGITVNNGLIATKYYDYSIRKTVFNTFNDTVPETTIIPFITVSIINNEGLVNINSYEIPYKLYINDELAFDDPTGLISSYEFTTTNTYNTIVFKYTIDGQEYTGNIRGSPINFIFNNKINNI